MNSNIEFKSNVYPINGSAREDMNYRAKIYDHVRLRYLDEKLGGDNFTYRLFNTFQRKIIKERPICSSCKPDPCWGMAKISGEIVWVCKCVKTDCASFNTCRPDFDDKELLLFSPVLNKLTGYKYEYKCSEPKYYSVIYSDDPVEYDTNIRSTTSNIKKSDDENRSLNVVEIVKVLKRETILQSEQESIIIAENYAHSLKAVELIPLEEENDIIIEPPVAIHIAIPNPPENIFDCFKETTQNEIITTPSKDVLFVDAGPGTGKTYTLIQKINYMVTEEGIDPQGVLVLCFTNAAVDEIKSRLKDFIASGADRGLANVDIRTFHSFAWWLLNQCNELFCDAGWTKIQLSEIKSFDESIRFAQKAMSQFSRDIVGNWEHFIVDEVQDLTNDLGRFVLQIVNCCLKSDCGVTVLGDSCQAIYDFTQKGCRSPLASGEFYETMFRNLFGKAKYYKLTENHRQSTSLIEMNSEMRTAILSGDTTNMKKAAKSIMGEMQSIDKNINLFSVSDFDKLRNEGKVCMLSRNNGQTLKISSNLRKRGISHQLNVAETNRNFSPWIADVFASYTKPKIAFNIFEERYLNSDDMLLDVVYVWSKLRELLHSDDDVLVVKDILDGISHSKIDDPIFRVRSSENIIVSNIHRAKGREYECVVFDKSFGNSLTTGENKIDEYKTMYVALTRPKSGLVAAANSNQSDLYPIDIFASNRRRWGARKKKKMTYLEFMSSTDIDINQFAFVDQSVFNNINVGDSLLLKRVIENGVVSYDMFAEDLDIRICKISQSYSDDIKNCMRIDEAIYMPSTISDLYISGIYTQIVAEDYLLSHPNITKTAPLGVWKWIDVIGADHLSYDIY